MIASGKSPVHHATATVAAVQAREVIRELAQGNKIFAARRTQSSSAAGELSEALVDKLVEDAFNPVQTKAIVISCARSLASIDSIFNAKPGELQVIRVCGNVCTGSLVGRPGDAVVGSVEFALSQTTPHVVLVLGNSQNFVIEAAVIQALTEANATETLLASEANTTKLDPDLASMRLLELVLPSARDAILQQPHAPFADLCVLTAQLNVWNTINTLMSSSPTIHDNIVAGRLQLHGAYFDVSSGKVHFLGTHPTQEDILAVRPLDDEVRTAEAPPLPAEQAYAALFTGNRRYFSGKGGQFKYSTRRLAQLSEAGQNPIAVVLGCSDSRAPIEILFDARPGDLFVLRNAGNTCASKKGSIIGSAEYAVAHLHTKLLVVSGHTKCGAVTAAVDAVARNKSLDEFTGSIRNVLEDLHSEAHSAVKLMPEAKLAEQVDLATKLNVFATIEKILKFSKIIRDGVLTMDLQIHGAVYDINSGEVMWLGQHPELEKIVGIDMPVHRWHMQAAIFSRPGVQKGSLAAPMLTKLRDGNQRFMRGEVQAATTTEVQKPFAVVLAGAEIRVPIEKIFDCGPGDLVVQQCLGNIAGSPRGTLFVSLEFAVVRFKPKLLLVLGESDSAIIGKALALASGAETASFGPTHIVLEQILVAAVRAIEQKAKAQGASLTAAGREMRIRKMAVELNALYTAEQLLRHSSVIRDAVRHKQLELHMGILNEATGEVNFIGMHPMQTELLREPSDVLAAANTPSWQCDNPGHCDIEEHAHVHGPNCGHDHH